MALTCDQKNIALLRGISPKHYSDFFCLNCFHSLRTKNKLQCNKKACENKDSCSIIMTSEYTKILEFNQYEKSDKMSFIIYSDLQ